MTKKGSRAKGKAKQAAHHEHTRRDAETQMLLGAFVFILGLPVLVGVFFEEETPARIVSIVSGLALVGIGAAFFLYGRRWFGRTR